MTIHLVRELTTLHRNILSMCAMVEEIVTQAVDELSEPTIEKAAELARRDDEIDRWDVDIEEECLKLLALYQPVAGDLRRITTVLKLSNELERIADLGVHIAERAADLALHPPIVVPPKLKHMARIALDMVHRSIDSYVQEDAELARQVCATDDEVDRLNREIIEELIGIMRQSPDNIEPALHLFSASRHVERIADHATNIGEDVVYLVEGEIIRHRPVREGGKESGGPAPTTD